MSHLPLVNLLTSKFRNSTHIGYIFIFFFFFAIVGVLLQILHTYFGDNSIFQTIYHFFISKEASTSRDFYFEMQYLNIFILSVVIFGIYSLARRSSPTKKTIVARIVRILVLHIVILFFGIAVFSAGFHTNTLYLEAYIGLTIGLSVIILFSIIGQIIPLLLIHVLIPQLYAIYTKTR